MRITATCALHKLIYESTEIRHPQHHALAVDKAKRYAISHNEICSYKVAVDAPPYAPPVEEAQRLCEHGEPVGTCFWCAYDGGEG